MRIPRRFILAPASVFHLLWRGHNRESVLRSPREKKSYLDFLRRALASRADPHVRLFSFCLMSNHPHFTGEIDPRAPSIAPLSRLFQLANGLFGRWYNRAHRRSGKVAEDRFKTLQIQDERHLQAVMFYSDANPVRAGLVKHPKDYRWSSYRHYAFGERGVGSDLLTEPVWYTELGANPLLRQKAYRRLVDAYLRSAGLIRDGRMTAGWFIGIRGYVAARSEELRSRLRSQRAAAAGARAP